MFEELIISVEGSESELVDRAGLADLGLREREHLQNWVIAHPEILGEGTELLTSEDDKWQTQDGVRVLDRLDVLGIDPDGRLVVAELKRGEAPHNMHMQAVTYAAFVSRLKVRDVADLVARAVPRTRAALSLPDDVESIATALETQLGVTESTLKNPRIVLVASDFPANVTASAVWLNERDLDVALVRFRPYRLADGQVIVSFARVYPVPDAEEFTIGRRRAEIVETEPAQPRAPWDRDSLENLSRRANAATAALMDLCAAAEDAPVTVLDIQAAAGLTSGQVRGQLAGLTMLLKNAKYGFDGRGWPVRIDWQPGGVANYYLHEGLRPLWLDVRGGQSSPTGDMNVPT